MSNSYIPYKLKGNFTIAGNVPETPGKYKIVISGQYYPVGEPTIYDYTLVFTFEVKDDKKVSIMGIILICIFITIGVIGVIMH